MRHDFIQKNVYLYYMSDPTFLPSYRFLGYLNELNQQSKILRLYGRYIPTGYYEYYASHDSHPFMRFPICQQRRPLCDQELIKIPGYLHPYRVNIYEESSLAESY